MLPPQAPAIKDASSFAAAIGGLGVAILPQLGLGSIDLDHLDALAADHV